MEVKDEIKGLRLLKRGTEANAKALPIGKNIVIPILVQVRNIYYTNDIRSEIINCMSSVSRFIAVFVFLTTFFTQPATSTTTTTTLATTESPGSFHYMHNIVFCDDKIGLI